MLSRVCANALRAKPLRANKCERYSALMKPYPYSFHIALDGNGINGIEGMAGVCVFLFDPIDNSYAYKIKYFDGASAGHAVSVSPDCATGFLGNAGQHLVFYDAATGEEVDRVS